MDFFEGMSGLMMGVGLAAACGFRIFVPLFAMSLASLGGHLDLAPEMAWLGTPGGAMVMGAATVVEILAYYVPWIDNLLDSIATPAAMIAGTMVTASFVTGMDPALKWTLAAILGGGSAGTIQGATVLTRGLSSATTGGFGNGIVSTIEAIGATILSFLAVAAPFLAVIAVVGLIWFALKKILRWVFGLGKKRPALGAPVDGVVTQAGPVVILGGGGAGRVVEVHRSTGPSAGIEST